MDTRRLMRECNGFHQQWDVAEPAEPAPVEALNRPAAIVHADLEGVISGWSPAAEEMFGYGAGQAVGRSMILIVPLNRAEDEADVLRVVSRGEQVEDFPTERRRDDGRVLYGRLTALPTFGPDCRVVGVTLWFRTSRQ